MPIESFSPPGPLSLCLHKPRKSLFNIRATASIPPPSVSAFSRPYWNIDYGGGGEKLGAEKGLNRKKEFIGSGQTRLCLSKDQVGPISFENTQR